MSDEKLPPWADPETGPMSSRNIKRNVRIAVRKSPVDAAANTLLAHFNLPDNASIWICKRNGVVSLIPVVHGSKLPVVHGSRL